VVEPDRRQSNRQPTKAHGVRCRTTLPDGTSLTGLVCDCSDGGARIEGHVSRDHVGSSAELVFMFRTDEAVRYQATIRWVDTRQGLFGVRFDSAPIPLRVLTPEAMHKLRPS